MKNNYDQVRFTVKKGKKEELKIHCSKFGYKSLNDFINQAVNEKIARDLGEI
ncbi:antitoxin [Blautia faecis]|uniref:Antitoxin n=1 Tax=Blautia faecis TaxID=871665 RepID=A0ABX2H2Y4_9FIRM|nr:antitoxin [Blautia faecis]